MNKLAVIVLSVGLAACSQKKPEEGREPVQTASPGSVVGSAAPGSPRPSGTAGGAAGGGAAPGSGTAETPPAGPAGGAAPPGSASAPTIGCATATTLSCGADQSDGCTGGLTAVHVCVAKDAKPGPPCAQEVALSCPPGQVDACLHQPPLANHHLCVVR